MSKGKVFGYSGTDGDHWFGVEAYGTKEIQKIVDPDGGNAESMPCAIPTPFARMDLVKAAFENIEKTPELKHHKQTTKDGSTIVIASSDHEKLVSDTLDLCELMFNYDTISQSQKLEIITWNRNNELKDLMEGGNPKHRRYAETLEMFLEQDKDTFNFEGLDKIYLIKFNHQIIGATSSLTLFFTTGNDLTFAQLKIAKKDVIFDEDYAPLYERDPEFQKYLWLLFECNPLLKSKMSDFYRYLQKNLTILNTKNPSLYKEIQALKSDDFTQNFEALDTGTANDNVSVLGCVFRKRKSQDIIQYIKRMSGFKINSTKFNDDLPPLVLQNDFTISLQYAKENWDAPKVPFEDERTLDKRYLPGFEHSIKYPYLTVSDFLEPKLVRLIYPINDDKYYTGKVIVNTGDDSKGFLLPLKPAFFEYFDAGDLMSVDSNTPNIEITMGVANSVRVCLTIPIQEGHSIVFERVYKEKQDASETNNKGKIVEQRFGMTLFPFIKTNDENISPNYRVQLLDSDTLKETIVNDYELHFYNNKSPKKSLNTDSSIRTDKNSSKSKVTSKYYILKNEFDFIQVSTQQTNGVIIPKWKPYTRGNSKFSFAVDFGTTNTHIEISEEDNEPVPFSIENNDEQIASLFDPARVDDALEKEAAFSLKASIDMEFVPKNIGSGFDTKFPHRTVLYEKNNFDPDKTTHCLADYNIPFVYGKIALRDGKVVPNLKWAKRGKLNEIRSKGFFEELIMLMRSKVLLNGGDPNSTELTWFFPSSMSSARIGDLTQNWNETFKNYFPNSPTPTRISESLAPFYHIKHKFPGGGMSAPAVGVDIGGGTTDVVIFQQGNPQFMTSFKMAANTLFGDGFQQGIAPENGILNKYIPEFKKLLKANKLTELSFALDDVISKKRSEDINSFLFSIENNPKVERDQADKFSYSKMLAKDGDLKVVFLYFYTSIIYHVALITKAKNIEKPKDLFFSGTGSKVLNIITSDKKYLQDLSQKIFEDVYGEKYETNKFKITQPESPKELTCKGGLKFKSDDEVMPKDIFKIYTGLEGKEFDKLTYNDVKSAGEIFDQVADKVKEFNRYFLSLNQELNFKDLFGVSEASIKILRDGIDTNVKDYIVQGTNYNKELDEVTDDNSTVSETFFFYPIIGLIKDIRNELTSIKK